MIKLSDFVANFIAEQGISHVFGVTGGAVAHLFDSVSRHPKLKPIFHHHEQAAAFAAQSYARVNNTAGCALVTTGPGGTNALTGVAAAWLDSIPCLYISGQTRLSHTSHGKGLRQFGTQELDIVTLASPIVKKAFFVKDPNSIQQVLQEALFIANSGRPGPVWIDIPLDVQWAMIDPATLSSFTPPPFHSTIPTKQIYELLSQAKRPLALIGHGVRLAKAGNLATKWLQTLKLPYLSTWNATDLFPDHDPLHIGRPGLFGQRGANLAMQNADLLLVFGSHLCTSITGTLFQAFAREAKIVMVNIDEKELSHRTVPVHLPVQADAGLALKELIANLPKSLPTHFDAWTKKCAFLKRSFNGVSQDVTQYGCTLEEPLITPYHFVDLLSRAATPNDLFVIDGGGTIVQIAFQTLKLKLGQRLLIDAGLCAMGSGLPQSIGAYFAHGNNVICLCGDGSLQFNVHELQTIAHHKLPIKLFVLNNNGYLSIRHTQKSFLKSNYAGSSSDGGLSLPDTLEIAAAYRIPAVRISSKQESTLEALKSILAQPGPFICEVLIPSDLSIAPKQGFRENKDGTFSPAPLEEMHPPLSDQVFAEAMSINRWKPQ